MCEFCVKHGEGKKWYLRMENYSMELAERLGSIDTGVYFGRNFDKILSRGERAIRIIKRLPVMFQKAAFAIHAYWQKRMHLGQVLPIEDVYQVLDMMSSIVRLPCLCRRYTIKDEGRYCLGITLDPMSSTIKKKTAYTFFDPPDVSNLEFMTKEEAKKLVKEFDDRGLIHTIWTLKTPYIVSVCNCELTSCTGFRLHYEGLKTIFRAEYVAIVNPEKCVGCRRCISRCPFGAIYYNSSTKKIMIDPKKCYGCGLCRNVCSKDAISLIDRKDHVVARDIW